MLINNPVITGSFLVNGVNVAGITGSSALSSSFLTTSASYAAASASLSTRVTNVETTASVLTTASASFAVVSSSFATTSGSISSRVNIIETSYATTGSNNFTAPQQVSNTSNAISFTSTASLYTAGGLRVSRDSFVSGTAYFNNVVVYGTSSIQYITSSQVNIGTNIITVNTDTPAVRFGGLAVFDSGSTALTGSLLWDSQNNRWIYSNPSGSTYDGGMLISGPRNSTGLGNEVGTTACAVMIGQGGDHITSSGIFSYGNATCFYGTSLISGSGNACFSGQVCSATIVSAGTIQGTTVYGSTALCGGVICGTNATFNGDVLITNSSNAQIGLNTTGALNSVGAYLYFNRSGVNKWTAGMGPQDGSDDYQIVTAGIKALNVKASTGIAILACQTCAPGMDIMPSGIGVSTLGGIMRVVTTGTSTGIAIGQSNANRYTHFAANDIQVFNDDYFIATRCAFPLSIGTCYTARLTFAATGEACFTCQICVKEAVYVYGAFPSVKLDRAGTTAQSDITWRNAGTSVWSIGTAVQAVGSNLDFYNYTLGGNVLKLTTTGDACFKCRVGIGAAAHPTRKLRVSQDVGDEWIAEFIHTGTNPYGIYIDTSANASTVSAFQIYANSGNGLKFTNDSKLGIGTTSPRGNLDVSDGNVNISGEAIFQALITGGNRTSTVDLTANLTIQTNDAVAANKGGSLAFGGRALSASTSGANWAGIAGLKTNGTSADYTGYLQFWTRGGSASEKMRITSDGNMLFNGTSDPGGIGNIYIGNTGSVPGTPSGGGVLYVQGGALKFKGSSGTVTTIANA